MQRCLIFQLEVFQELIQEKRTKRYALNVGKRSALQRKLDSAQQHVDKRGGTLTWIKFIKEKNPTTQKHVLIVGRSSQSMEMTPGSTAVTIVIAKQGMEIDMENIQKISGYNMQTMSVCITRKTYGKIHF